MKIENTLFNIETIKHQNEVVAQNVTTPSGEAFSDIFNAAMGLVEETSDYQKTATSLQLDFVSGKTDDILAVTMAQEKALSTLSYTVQITNKVIDAYKEIMQVQL
ncbi:MAG: flagellar hook-basal body complex protein FliE [Lachnospirales bacterium]